MKRIIIFNKEHISLGLNIVGNIWDNVRTKLYIKQVIVILGCFNVEMLHIISIISLSKMH